MSILSALAILFSWFSSYPGISKQVLDKLLHILHCFILPSGNLLLASYSKAYSRIQHLLIPVEEYHCCPNDCILYRGPHADKTHCPKCGSERFENGKVPQKRFKYLPLSTRIQRFFHNATTSKLFQSHVSASESDHIDDIHQTDTWKQWYSKDGMFHGDGRGLSLTLCTDGTNPYSKEKMLTACGQ